MHLPGPRTLGVEEDGLLAKMDVCPKAHIDETNRASSRSGCAKTSVGALPRRPRRRARTSTSAHRRAASPQPVDDHHHRRAADDEQSARAGHQHQRGLAGSRPTSSAPTHGPTSCRNVGGRPSRPAFQKLAPARPTQSPRRASSPPKRCTDARMSTTTPRLGRLLNGCTGHSLATTSSSLLSRRCLSTG